MRITPQTIVNYLTEELDANYPYSVVPIFTSEYKLYDIVIEKGKGSFASAWVCNARDYENALRHMTWETGSLKALITADGEKLDEVTFARIESACLQLGYEYISIHPTNLGRLHNQFERSLALRI